MALQNLDINVYKQIAERMKAERDEAAKIKPEQIITPTIQPVIVPSNINPAAQDKIAYVYVPALRLYLSQDRYLQGTNWINAKEILHKEGKRMPTIPEFIEFIKYLRSDKGKAEVINSRSILNDIYQIGGKWRSELLDAKFEKQGDDMFVSYHVFDNNRKIIQKQEKLEDYFDRDKFPGLDFESWLTDPTMQGLPRLTCPEGSLYYQFPRAEGVTRFVVDSAGVLLDCQLSLTCSDNSFGVRYVRPLMGATQ